MRPIKHKASSEQATSVPCSASLYSSNRTIVCINQYKWSTNQITPANATATSAKCGRVWPLSFDIYNANISFLNLMKSSYADGRLQTIVQPRCLLYKCLVIPGAFTHWTSGCFSFDQRWLFSCVLFFCANLLEDYNSETLKPNHFMQMHSYIVEGSSDLNSMIRHFIIKRQWKAFHF